ncbi:MAG TPA: acyl-CoA dehydrogenase, partial [Beijerinckiaceae bacterium]|nr:acyl-CoA dehydrogenase [Beijerinckiaceae bacterium]
MTALPAAAASTSVVTLGRAAAQDVANLVAEAGRRLRARVTVDGRLSPERLEAEQHAAHGLAWLATYGEAIRELAAYAARQSEEARFGE